MMTMKERLFGSLMATALMTGCAGTAVAAEYKWPDKLPPEAIDQLKPLPLTSHGQPVPGFP